MSTAMRQGEHMVRQAIQAWDAAVGAWVSMQEEYAKWMREMCCEAGSLAEWYNKAQSALGQAIVKTQENVDEAVRLVNQQAESTMTLMQKAIEVRKTESPVEVEPQMLQWWESAMETTRANTEAIIQSNGRIFSSWSQLVRKSNGDVASELAGMAQKGGGNGH